MGSIVTRLLVEKGAQLVGAVGRSPAKVGRDLGDVAGLGTQLGVPVSDDPSEVLARAEADVAVVAVASYLQPMFEHFKVCLENGTNVITIEEESFYPWSTAPELARRLDDLAKRHDVTIMGSGAQDVYWMALPSMLMARRAPGGLGARRDEVERGRLRARGGRARARRIDAGAIRNPRREPRMAVVRRPQHRRCARRGRRSDAARGADVGDARDRQRHGCSRGRWGVRSDAEACSA